MLTQFDCELNEKIRVVTDRGSNMKAAFEHARNIFCINHLINNVIERSISESSEVNAVVTTCSKLVKYFKKSGSNSALNTTLKSYTPTRWNTVFYLLSSIQINWVDITQILQEKHEVFGRRKISNDSPCYSSDKET